MDSHDPQSPSSPDLTFMERAIIVRALTAMRENDTDAAPASARLTQAHCDLTRAMKDARAHGAGSQLQHAFGPLSIRYEVLGERSTRITVTRTAHATPYPTLPFQTLLPLPGVQLTDHGNGTYVFDITIRQFDDETLAAVAGTLDRAGTVTLLDAEARALGLEPEQIQ